jgi:hypothetical protein
MNRGKLFQLDRERPNHKHEYKMNNKLMNKGSIFEVLQETDFLPESMNGVDRNRRLQYLRVGWFT